jgi:hypothetical protein
MSQMIMDDFKNNFYNLKNQYLLILVILNKFILFFGNMYR